HIEAHLAAGGRLHQVTRHMLGLFADRPGAVGWRRVLSTEAGRPGGGSPPRGGERPRNGRARRGCPP
ncbi:MAG TPA: hypothetical protein PKE47_10130, partial [Verrucomicrobiota bacterium]|nr:hypothetical protein [Verrucomicrobiota bacterium]